jgi:hypothetical protein
MKKGASRTTYICDSIMGIRSLYCKKNSDLIDEAQEDVLRNRQDSVMNRMTMVAPKVGFSLRHYSTRTTTRFTYLTKHTSYCIYPFHL